MSPKWQLQASALLLLATVIISLVGCGSGSDDSLRIQRLWGMGYISSNDMVASEGREWFEFHADGTLDSRTSPFTYERGLWRMNEVDQTLTLRGGGQDSLVYQYQFRGDTLFLSAMMEAFHHKIGMCLVPISKKPIDREEEMGSTPSPDSLP